MLWIIQRPRQCKDSSAGEPRISEATVPLFMRGKKKKSVNRQLRSSEPAGIGRSTGKQPSFYRSHTPRRRVKAALLVQVTNLRTHDGSMIFECTHDSSARARARSSVKIRERDETTTRARSASTRYNRIDAVSSPARELLDRIEFSHLVSFYAILRRRRWRPNRAINQSLRSD